MLRLILRILLALVALRVVVSLFRAGRPQMRPPAPRPPVPDAGRRGKLAGDVVDADFEDLPGEEKQP